MSDETLKLFKSGQLDDAVKAAQTAVKSKPTSQADRALLAEFLCFAGEFEKADKHFDILTDQAPELGPAFSVIRQVIRAELARREVFFDGRVPSFLFEPDETMKLQMRALVEWQAGAESEARTLFDDVEGKRAAAKGICNGTDIDDFRDADDRLGGVMEVLTGTGDYYWIPAPSIRHLTFAAPKRPRDLMWRQASIDVENGPDGEVFIPVLYPIKDAPSRSSLQLGHETDWRAEDNGPVIGFGQRVFLAGDEPVTVMELKELKFADAA